MMRPVGGKTQAGETKRPVTPTERVRELVGRHRRPPRPLPWGSLLASVFGVGFGVGVLFLGFVIAAVLGLVGVALPASVAVGIGVLATAGFVVDGVRLWRICRAVRQGVVLTATVEPAQEGSPGRRRVVPHPGGEVRDEVSVPREAPNGELAQSVLVDPDRPRVWMTLHPFEALPTTEEERASRPSGERLSGWSPLTGTTSWGRLAVAWRVGVPLGLALIFVGVVLALVTTGYTGSRLGWLLLSLVVVAVVAVAVVVWRVRVRVDARGVRVRSSLFTRSRPWDELERLVVDDVEIASVRYGSKRFRAAVLAFEDYLGARLRAISTVRCWNEPWFVDLVRRCEAAGVDVDSTVTDKLPVSESEHPSPGPG